MNAQRPDLQLELQNFLVQPGLEGGAKLDPLRHSVVADLRQHPAFFLTHLYCQVLPVLATFMNRYGPNLCALLSCFSNGFTYPRCGTIDDSACCADPDRYMASLRSSTHLKDSLSNVRAAACSVWHTVFDEPFVSPLLSRACSLLFDEIRYCTSYVSSFAQLRALNDGLVRQPKMMAAVDQRLWEGGGEWVTESKTLRRPRYCNGALRSALRSLKMCACFQFVHATTFLKPLSF